MLESAYKASKWLRLRSWLDQITQQSAIIGTESSQYYTDSLINLLFGLALLKVFIQLSEIKIFSYWKCCSNSAIHFPGLQYFLQVNCFTLVGPQIWF